MHAAYRRPVRGFSLIELMIVCAIVAILMAIAVPGYAYYMKKSRRSSTEAVMMDIAQREQQYLIDKRSYAPDLATLYGSANATAAIPADVQQFYTVNICGAAPPAACGTPGVIPPVFVVVAAPIAGTAQASDYTLTLDQTGLRLPASVW